MIARTFRWTMLWLGLTVAPAASAVKIEIDQALPAPAGALADPVRVTFANARPPKEGGDELPLVGQLRSLAGVPYGTFTKKVHLDALIVGATTAALRNVGVDASPNGASPAPRVHVEVKRFWGDGNIGYAMHLDAVIQLIAEEGQPPVWEHDVHLSSETKAYFAPKKELPRAYETLLATYVDQITAAFGSATFRDRLRAEPSSSSTPATAPGCGMDTDCKGDRICSAGVCVDPA